MSLPLARDENFVEANRRPLGIDPQYLRLINDTALRSRLIMAGIAEGLQSPKGPQRIKSIVRLYPDFDAPRTAFGLPTVEELNALLTRIHQAEREVSHELQGRIHGDIDRLKKLIATLEGDDFERAFRDLDSAMRQRRELGTQIREEAFRRIDADGTFEPRRYLRLIARERA